MESGPGSGTSAAGPEEILCEWKRDVELQKDRHTDFRYRMCQPFGRNTLSPYRRSKAESSGKQKGEFKVLPAGAGGGDHYDPFLLHRRVGLFRSSDYIYL